MLNMILMNLIASGCAFLIIEYFLSFKILPDYIITFIVLFFTQIVLTLQLTGLTNSLYLNNVIMANLVILFFIILFIKVRKLAPKNNLLGRLNQAVSSLHFNKVELLLLSIILGFGIVKITVNLVNPPFGWDDLNYHFTFPVEWLKNHNLVNPMVVFCDPSPTYYPINGSLFYFWFILPLKNVFVADLGQVPFFIMAFFAVYSLGRKLALPRQYAFFAASLFTLIPNYFKQMNIAYVDIMVAALFLAALNYLFLLDKGNTLANTVLFSICAGLMIGVKTTSLPFAALLMVPFLYFVLRKFSPLKSIPTILICILILIIMGGFSYIKNLLEAGNPLYPLNLKIFGKTIFKGVMDNSVYRAHVLPQDYALGKILFSEGLGVQALIFMLPGILLGLPVVLFKKKGSTGFNLFYFLVLPFLLILAYRFIIPLPNLRYIYCLFAVALIIAFYIADLLKFPRKIINILVVLCVLVSAGELAKRQELVSSIIFSVLFFFLLSYLLKIMKQKYFIRLTAVFLAIIFLALPFLEKDYVKNEYKRYIKMVKYSGFWPDAARAWDWLNENTSGDNIAYVGRPVPFPLYGSNFKNNVYYISLNSIEPARLSYYKNSCYVWGYDGESVHKSFEEENNYRGKPDYLVWLRNLKTRGTDYLFVYSLHQIKTIEFPIEDQWAATHPETFDLVFKNDTIHIYKIRR